jgi:LysM repeat protein/Tfp pilus assembly protein PilF
MIRVSAPFLSAALFILIGLLTGCVPGEDDHNDEMRDPNYLRGCAMVKSRDFDGAVEEFEKALEVNPHSAEAHFQIAWLCEEKQKDYAAAIYHYQKHLALRPNSENAIKAKDHIIVCKRELAKAEFAPPSTLALQREIDRLNAENLLLKQQMETLRTQLAAAVVAAQSPQVPIPLAVAPSQTPSPTPSVSLPPDAATRTSVSAPSSAANPAFKTPVLTPTSRVPMTSQSYAQPPSSSLSPGLGLQSPARDVSPARPRTHAVKSGETLASIASDYHVKLAALMQANPSINPRKLRIGQTLNLP